MRDPSPVARRRRYAVQFAIGVVTLTATLVIAKLLDLDAFNAVTLGWFGALTYAALCGPLFE